jgi:hypothetical protein
MHSVLTRENPRPIRLHKGCSRHMKCFGDVINMSKIDKVWNYIYVLDDHLQDYNIAKTFAKIYSRGINRFSNAIFSIFQIQFPQCNFTENLKPKKSSKTTKYEKSIEIRAIFPFRAIPLKNYQRCLLPSSVVSGLSCRPLKNRSISSG